MWLWLGPVLALGVVLAAYGVFLFGLVPLTMLSGLYDYIRTPHSLVQLGLAQPHKSRLTRWLDSLDQ